MADTRVRGRSRRREHPRARRRQSPRIDTGERRMTAAIQLTDLGKCYGKQWALRDCSLTLPAGTVAALVGPNGAGKTTLIQLAVGLIEPTRGEIRVFGESPRGTSAASLARIRYVAQDHPLYR